ARLVLREVEDDDPVERLAHVASIVAGAASPARTVGGLPQVRRGPPARLAPWVACLRCAGGRQPGSHRGWPASGAPGAASPARTVGGLPQVRRGPPARLAPWVACLRCAGGRQPGSHRGRPASGAPGAASPARTVGGLTQARPAPCRLPPLTPPLGLRRIRREADRLRARLEVGHDVDDRRLAGGPRPLERRPDLVGLLDELAVRAEVLRDLVV